MKTAYDYFLEFSQELKVMNDEEFILNFNKSIGINVFGIPRQGILWALREELKRRNLDYS